ncbi:putative methyltransferase-domain-containing protein [Xylariales sp. AK1849]|nr:putative methyltransferase-domain-containing protein [Xylariales sp. AK1849]
MHYIRLLRSPTVDISLDGPVLTLKLTITTDLGDTFLSPDEPVWLLFPPIRVYNTRTAELSYAPTDGSRVLWKPGMRMLKVVLPFPRKALKGRADVGIQAVDPEYRISADETALLLPWRMKKYGNSKGLIAPLTVEVNDGVGADVLVREISCRSNSPLDPTVLKIEEDIGESLARHIWDAGLVTTALLADGCRKKGASFHIQDFMPITKEGLNIIEIGCGVGVLGIGIGTFIHTAAKVQGIKDLAATVLLTDLPEAEERAKANIARYEKGLLPHDPRTLLMYENLDWEDGSRGAFGPIAGSHFWDYIVLSDCTYNVDTFPVLVGTLSALHAQNLSHMPTGDTDKTTTKVILSSKPRHDSEKALFELLRMEGWKYRLLKSVPLLKLDGEDEAVEVYSLEKRGDQPAQPRKREGVKTAKDLPRDTQIQPLNNSTS